MPNLVLTIAAAALWLVVLFRARRMLGGTSTERSLWCVLIMFAGSVTLLIDPLRQAVVHGRATSTGYALATFTVAVLACVSARSLVVCTSPGPTARRRSAVNAALAGAALAGGAVSYLLAPPLDGRYASLAQHPQQIGVAGPVLRAAAFLVYLSWALVGMSRVSLRYARHAPAGPLRKGLMLGGVGCLLGFGCVALKTVVVAGWVAQANIPLARLNSAADGVALSSMLLIVAGASWQLLTAQARSVVSATTDIRARRQLRPLWQALQPAAPLDGGQLPAVGARLRLVRRVVEIRDRQLSLRCYASRATHQAALLAAEQAGYRGSDASAVAEAAWLETARRAKASGAAPATHLGGGNDVVPTGGGALDEEVRWLQQVTHAYQHVPLVHQLANRWAATH